MQDTMVPRENIFAVYGFGSVGKLIVDKLLDMNLSVRCIIDRSKCGVLYQGIPVIHLKDIGAYDVANMTCLIGLHNNNVDLGELHEDLSTSGFKDVFSLINCRNIGLRFDVPYGYWLDMDFSYAQFGSELKSLRGLLADEKSKQVLDATVRYRTHGELKDSPVPSLRDEYTPEDLPRYKQPLRLVDCGSYTGVAIEKFLAAGYAIESLVAFEPDIGNYRTLARRDFGATMALCLPLGIWSTTTQLRFNNLGTMGSAIGEFGETVIQCVRGDDVLNNYDPNLLKFDIEGAEVEALIWLERTIRLSRPNMCVSLYHRPAHLFQVPLLINSWGLDYKYYIRVHEYNTFGMVLYCLNDSLVES